MNLNFSIEFYGAKEKARQQRALDSHVPTNFGNILVSAKNQEALAKALGAESIGGQSPFDVIDTKNKMGIEVKTLVNQKNDKLTQHPASWRRKVKEAKKLGLKNIVTVAFDNRKGKGGQIYYRLGVGSFDLHTMIKVNSLQQLKSKLDKVHDAEAFGTSYGSFNVRKK